MSIGIGEDTVTENLDTPEKVEDETPDEVHSCVACGHLVVGPAIDGQRYCEIHTPEEAAPTPRKWWESRRQKG